MNPPLAHILVLTDFPESTKLKRLHPEFAEDLMNYKTKTANRLSARPRQIISLDNYGLALGFNPHVDQLKSFAFTHSVKGKAYWIGACLRMVLCEVTMPYMVSADQQYLQAVENARSHVWRIGVIQMTESLGSTTLSTSSDSMDPEQRMADLPLIIRELQQITTRLIQAQCDVCVAEFAQTEPDPLIIDQPFTFGDARMDQVYFDWTQYDQLVMDICAQHSANLPLYYGVGVAIISLAPKEEEYLSGARTQLQMSAHQDTTRQRQEESKGPSQQGKKVRLCKLGILLPHS